MQRVNRGFIFIIQVCREILPLNLAIKYGDKTWIEMRKSPGGQEPGFLEKEK